MKVIFLDIDGVLNCEKTAQRHRGVIGIDPFLVAIFNRIIFATDAKIVLSSTWRLSKNGQDEVRVQVMDFIDVTPRHRNECNVSPLCHRRGCEIKDWLDAYNQAQKLWPQDNEPIEKYAIIDDDNDMLSDQPLFQTTWAEGLTPEIAERVVAYLNAV